MTREEDIAMRPSCQQLVNSRLDNPEDAERDLPEIEEVIRSFEESAGRNVAIEVEPVRCFYRAEEYHQNYLDKNPGGYCHLSPEIFQLAKQLKKI